MSTILVVPFYSNENYILNLENYFKDNPQERLVFSSVYVIDDCPGSKNGQLLKDVCNRAGFIYIQNKENIGFLGSANIGFSIAKKELSNMVLLNSDTLPYGNAFSELINCFAIDPMLGCISPRSNNATICNFYPKTFFIKSKSDFDKVTKDFDDSICMVPKISYAPVTNGFCIAVRSSVIQNFGGYSELFSPGYEEENEYCLRVSSHGFRIGIANHSLVGHLEGKSFGLKSGRDAIRKKHFEKLQKLYPWYLALLHQYEHEYETQAYKAISSTISSKTKKLLIDASNLGPYHNGTNKLIVEFLRGISRLNYQIDLFVNQEAFDYHGLNEISGLRLYESNESGIQYFYGIKIGQPFSHSELFSVPSKCVYSINIFFDTIALDCPQLRAEGPNIVSFWNDLTILYSHISFISEHTKNQFNLRFPHRFARCYSNLLPRAVMVKPVQINVGNTVDRDKPYALVVGNKFEHKGIKIALSQLPKINNLYYKVLGSGSEACEREDVLFIQSGNLDEFEIDALYRGSEFIVFPSFAEGFGYPLLEALTYKKSIFLRDIPCYREILGDIASGDGIFFLDDFSYITKPLKLARENTLNNLKENYVDYVRTIIEQANKELSIKIYTELCFKSKYITLANMNTSRRPLYNILRRIYDEFYKIKLIRPLLSLTKSFFRKIRVSKSYLLS